MGEVTTWAAQQRWLANTRGRGEGEEGGEVGGNAGQRERGRSKGGGLGDGSGQEGVSADEFLVQQLVGREEETLSVSSAEGGEQVRPESSRVEKRGGYADVDPFDGIKSSITRST